MHQFCKKLQPAGDTMTSTLIIFCVAFFITGSTVAQIPITGNCRGDAKVALDNDKAYIKRHYDNLLLQVQPMINTYRSEWNAVFNPVSTDLREVSTNALQILNPLNGVIFDATSNCNSMAADLSHQLMNVESEVKKCLDEASARLDAIGRQLETQYENEMEYLEGYKATVDKSWCYQLMGMIRPFAERKARIVQELTATYDNLSRAVNTEIGNWSKCIRDNVAYDNMKRNSAVYLTTIRSCVSQKITTSPVDKPTSDSTRGLEIPLPNFDH